MNEREQIILTALEQDGPQTCDEFVNRRGWYILSWAPTFTHLKRDGLIKRTGEKRLTIHGAPAFVLSITEQGRRALAGAK